MSREYSLGDVMAAVVDLRDATARGFANVDRRFDELTGEIDKRFDEVKYDMNRRFDSVDLRFDALEVRVSALEARV